MRERGEGGDQDTTGTFGERLRTASMRRGGWRGRGWRWHVAIAQLQLGGVKEEHGDGVETQLRQRVRKRSNVGAK